MVCWLGLDSAAVVQGMLGCEEKMAVGGDRERCQPPPRRYAMIALSTLHKSAISGIFQIPASPAIVSALFQSAWKSSRLNGIATGSNSEIRSHWISFKLFDRILVNLHAFLTGAGHPKKPST